jgi:hypothetical protein
MAALEKLHEAWDRERDGLTLVSAHATICELTELFGVALQRERDAIGQRGLAGRRHLDLSKHCDFTLHRDGR